MVPKDFQIHRKACCQLYLSTPLIVEHSQGSVLPWVTSTSHNAQSPRPTSLHDTACLMLASFMLQTETPSILTQLSATLCGIAVLPACFTSTNASQALTVLPRHSVLASIRHGVLLTCCIQNLFSIWVVLEENLRITKWLKIEGSTWGHLV